MTWSPASSDASDDTSDAPDANLSLLPSNLTATLALALVDEECIRHFIQDLILPSLDALNDELGTRMLHLSRTSITYEAVVDFVTIYRIVDLLAFETTSLYLAIGLVWTLFEHIDSLDSLKHFHYLPHA